MSIPEEGTAWMSLSLAEQRPGTPPGQDLCYFTAWCDKPVGLSFIGMGHPGLSFIGI